MTKPVYVVERGSFFSFYDSEDFFIGKIHRRYFVLWYKYSIICDSKKYEIKTTGFLRNDFEVFDDGNILYWSKFEKDQIRSRKNHFEIYKIKWGKTARIFLDDVLIFDLRVKNGWFKTEYIINVKEDFDDDVLIMLFFYFLTKEVNSIGGGD